MTHRRDRLWVAGGAGAAALIFVAAWFFAVNPVLSAADSLHAQTDDARTQNAALRAQTARLAAAGAQRGALEAALARAQAALPTGSGLPDFTRELASDTAANGIRVTSVTAGTPTAVGTSGSPSSTASAGTATSGSAGTATSGSAGTATSGSATSGAKSSGLYSIAVTVMMIGTAPRNLAFLSDLQVPGKRAALVTSATIGAATAGSAVTMTLQMQVFVAPQAAAKSQSR